MRNFAIYVTAVLLTWGVSNKVDGQQPSKQSPPRAGTPAAPKSAEKPKSSTSPSVADGQSGSSRTSLEEEAIRRTGNTFVAAFNQADAKATAEHYTTDAEYIDDRGRLIRGRQAIEESLKGFFTANAGKKLTMNIESIRFVGPGLAIEDGTTTLSGAAGSDTVTTRYTAAHLKNDGKWLVASVRDSAVKPPRPHKSKLRQLDWMLGEWVHEGNDATVVFKCEPIENGNFLLRHFTIKIAGVETISGSQRIGWDAQANKFRAWIFDSDGGHSDGYWHRDGDSWVLKTAGVTADGQAASNTTIYTRVDAHTMTFQSVDHEIAGVELPDSAKVTIVRHPPRPE